LSMESRSFFTADGVAVPLLVSAAIPTPFRHGFTTRAGGVSGPPFETLNLGRKWGDSPDSVDENHRRLLAVAGAGAMFRVSQVHGTRIVRVRRGDEPRAIASMQADGLCSDEPGAGLSIHVADCTPILLACPCTGACAALHAGWRGTVTGIARAGVETMVAQFGSRPEELRVALGPCIGTCCFEVGPEVVDALLAAHPAARDNGCVVKGRHKDHIDLRRVQRLELESAGVLPEHIDSSRDCTHCDPDGRFFSFRKAGRATGQMVGFVLAAVVVPRDIRPG
jgi:YfiH family protein